METVFKINDFDKLDEEVQQEIQDFVSGYAQDKWCIEFYSHCDICGKQKELKKLDTEGGIIRVCDICEKKVNNIISKLKEGKI